MNKKIAATVAAVAVLGLAASVSAFDAGHRGAAVSRPAFTDHNRFNSARIHDRYDQRHVRHERIAEHRIYRRAPVRAADRGHFLPLPGLSIFFPFAFR